jgi:uncharacterized membrane protein
MKILNPAEPQRSSGNVMADQDPTADGPGLTKSRLETLNDGIFAFAMTLLVISLSIPDKVAHAPSNEYIASFLVSLRPELFNYVIAFLILGSFWYTHHIQLHPVQTLDRTYIWLNILTLFFVALVPFSTSLSGDFSEVPLAAIVFEMNLLAIGIGLLAQWEYASKEHGLLRKSINPALTGRIRRRGIITPVVSVIAIIIALTGNTWSLATYLLIPFGAAFVRILEKKHA